MRSLPRLLTALALATALTSCGGGDGSDPTSPTSPTSPTAPTDPNSPTSADTPTSSDDTSTPAGDVEPTDEVTRAEAEAVGTAYVGLTEEEAETQAAVDERVFRVGERDGEQFALTEDYVLGRVTATITNGIVTEVTVESSVGPVTVGS